MTILRSIILTAFLFPLLVGCNSKSKDESPTTETTPSNQTSRLPADENWISFDTGANIKALALENDSLWLGMPNGLIRYDTRSIDKHEVFTTDSTQGGLMSQGIYTIKVDRSGRKWIGTYGGGLTIYDGKTWKTYTVADGLGDQWVYDMVFDGDLTWIATWKGVSVFDGKTFKTYTEKDGLLDKWVYAVAMDHDHVFWFGTESGVNRFDGKVWSGYTHKDGLGADVGIDASAEDTQKPSSSEIVSGQTPHEEIDYGATGSSSVDHHANLGKRNVGANPNFVIAVAIGHDNVKWFGTWGAGLSRYDGKQWTTFTKKDGLGGNFIHNLAVDRNGFIWAGTNGGVSWYDGQKWRNFSTEHGLVDNNVFSIAFSDNGDRWFGTWTGLSRFRGELPS